MKSAFAISILGLGLLANAATSGAAGSSSSVKVASSSVKVASSSVKVASSSAKVASSSAKASKSSPSSSTQKSTSTSAVIPTATASNFRSVAYFSDSVSLSCLLGNLWKKYPFLIYHRLQLGYLQPYLLLPFQYNHLDPQSLDLLLRRYRSIYWISLCQ